MEEARYRIQAVAKMTGVPAATLRAWERRYGVPRPQRTDSAYRLYSDDDVQHVQKLKAMCDAGIAPVDAARMVREGLEEPPLAATGGKPGISDPLELAADAIVEQARRCDPAGITRELRRAVTLGSAHVVVPQVLFVALGKIGDAWHEGQISVAHEHLASELVGNCIRDLVRLALPPNPTRSILLACAADEEHVLPLYGVALRSAALGWQPIVLGARTPPLALAQAVERLAPTLVGISFTSLPSPARGQELLGGYALACARTPWVVGGLATPKLQDAVDSKGGFTASTLRDVDALMRQLERAPKPKSPTNTR